LNRDTRSIRLQTV